MAIYETCKTCVAYLSPIECKKEPCKVHGQLAFDILMKMDEGKQALNRMVSKVKFDNIGKDDPDFGTVQHSPKDKPLPLSEETKELLAWAKKGDKS